MKLHELAKRLGGRVDGDDTVEIRGVTTLDAAQAGDVTFLANPKYASRVATTRASAIIANDELVTAPCPILRAADPYLAFTLAVGVFAPNDRPDPGISPLACVAADAHVGDQVHVGAFAWIGPGATIGARTIVHPHVVVAAGAVVGDDCVLYPHVSIRERCQIGHRVILQNGAVVGSDGYGFAPRPDGTYQKIPQTALVVIEDDVEVGANSTIDRPAVGETRIGAGTKIDNLVQIAHGVRVGERVLLCAQVGIAGSTTIGDGAILAGQVGVVGHIRIGAGARATAQTGISNTVPDNATVSGFPAIDNREWLRASVVFRRLPELKKAVADLERRLAALEPPGPNDPEA